MRLESIDLKGVLRFPNRIALDLSSLSGLVAIVGANGEGKTSLLEAFPGTLYRQLPSRAERELFDYAHDRDSYLQASFTMGTRRFRARVALDAVSRKSEAVLLETLPDGSERVLSDGKVSTYDAAIKANLPPQSVLLASAFASQNRRGSFVTLDRKGRRALFAELLGLEFYEAMAVTSRAAANLIEQGRTKLAGRREAVAAACAPAVETDIARRAKAEAVALEDTKDEQTALTSTIVALEAEEVIARAAANRYRQALDGQRAAHDAIRQIEQRIANVDQQQTAAREQQTREIALIGRDREAIATELARALAAIDAAAAADEKDKRDRIARNQQLLTDAPAIRQAQADSLVLDEGIAALEAAVSVGQLAIREVGDSREALRRKLEAAERDETELARTRQAAALLREVPCGGAGDFAGCALLKDAQAAAARIPDLEGRVAGAADLRGSVAELEQQLHDLREIERQRTADLERLRRDRAGAVRRTTGADRLAAASGRLEELTAAVDAIPVVVAQQRSAAEAQAQRQRQALDQRTTDVDNRAFAAIDQCAATLRELAVQCTAAKQAALDADDAVRPLAADAGRLEVVQRELAGARQRLSAVNAQIARVEERIAAIERERLLLARRREELAAIDAGLVALDAELLDWQTLAKVLGRDGLPNLEIDAAGPTVSADCNDLMQTCFSGRFSLDLVTQEPKADGKGMREAFELKVLDNERAGTARDVSDLSGGEQVIVDECLKAALSIFNNRRSQTPMRTCWRDETTGALDAANADRYVAMLRRLRDLAGFELILFVSHNADAAAQADAQIRVHDGTAEIVHAPFSQQEAA